MNKFKIITETSPLLVLLCVLIGAIYAFALYQKKPPWSKGINWLLAFLRFTVVTVICLLLLLNPMIRQIINTEEKPTIVFAIDNSQSIPSVNSKKQLNTLYKRLDKLSTDLRRKDIDIDIQQLDNAAINQNINTIPLNFQSTNLSGMLKTIQNNYENRNIDKVVLVSDGIYNQGVAPTFLNFSFPVHTLGLGDTTPKKDIKLASVLANKIAYLGNDFPIVAEIENVGFPNSTLGVYLSQNGKLIDKKQVRFGRDKDIKQVSFQATARQKGIQHYTVSVDVLEGEFTKRNNARDVYVEVIDGKEKILLVAASPHPDIKALRSVVENNANYDFDVFIPNINQLKSEKYDLVIFHQIPSIHRVGNELLEKFKNTASLFILGSQSDLSYFNRISKSLKVSARQGRMDKVTPIYDKSFNKFTFEDDKVSMINKLPPLAVPFGDYSISNSSEVILKQRVGSIETEKPLLLVNQARIVKRAVLTGEGIWQWRLEEYALSDSHESFDDLMSKLIQYLSTKEDKRRLRVYPISSEFYDFEKVVFESEVYNEIYERVYDQKINLSLVDEKGKTRTYSFTSGEGNTRFEISGLPKGVYRYTASAKIKGKVERASGEFTVRDLQLEALSNTADHNLLRQLSKKTDGKFFKASQVEALAKDLLDSPKPNLIHSSEELSEFINLKWIFFLLLGLITAEWVGRKYWGDY